MNPKVPGGKSTVSIHIGWAPAVSFITAALIWAQFRSYDTLDAATHFLTYQFPADNPDLHTHYPLIARPFWLLCGGNIVAFRLLCLALISTATYLFWRILRPILTAKTESSWSGLALWLTALAGIAWLPVLLGYNSLSTVFALLGLAALAYALRPTPRSTARTVARAAAALSFLAAVLATALVKPPAGLALVFWGGFLAFFILPLPRWFRLVALLAVGGLAVYGLFLFTHLFSAPGADPSTLRYFAGVTFSPLWIFETFARYARELSAFLPSLGVDLLFVCLPSLGLAAILLARHYGRTVVPFWSALALALLLISLIALVIVRQLWDGSYARAVSGEMARLYLVLWVALLPAAVVHFLLTGSKHDAPPRGANSPWIIALFFLPLTSGFGSTNTLYFSALNWTVFWTAGLLLLSRILADALGDPRLHRLYIATLVFVGGAHLFSGHFLRPYMNQPPLWRQNIPVSVGYPATTLKLDPATARFITEVRTTLTAHGYRPGDDVFGFFNLPGIVYAIGAVQPGAPWYFGTWYGGDDTDGGKLRHVPLARRQHAWIITQADVTGFKKQFHDSGIDFPEAYVNIGHTTNPATGLEIGLWKPLARP